MSTVEVRPFEDDDAPAVARVATAVQWPSLTEPMASLGRRHVGLVHRPVADGVPATAEVVRRLVTAVRVGRPAAG
ncbi:hypothetical protein [Nocardioides litoris]|uniref:hypothetical protein n=1 Tax=Nocardioides litoris TaxID=1926648 RepID=UPI0011211020|nr:hypothetical protein [Nocardioides litoris]